jgi:sphingosine kinase
MIDDPSSAHLGTPLLAAPIETMRPTLSLVATNCENNVITEWPTEEAKRAKLLIPQEYDPYQNQESPGRCFFRYDKDRELFLIVAESTGRTLDIIDPDDVVGVNVEIAMFGGHVGGGTSSAAIDESVVLGDDQGTGGVASPTMNEPTSTVPTDTQGSAVLTVYAYPKRDPSKESIFHSCGLHRKPKPVTELPAGTAAAAAEEGSSARVPNNKKSWHRQAHHRQFTVAPAEDFADLTTMVQAIRSIIKPASSMSTTTPREDRLLVIINPVSGRKKALEIYEKTVVPIFDQASVSYDYMVTSHARHAEERMKEQPASSDLKDLSEYTGIVSIGGDGVVHEIMQGIHSRPDSRKLLKTLKLGMIGAGSSNGLSASLAHASEVRTWYGCPAIIAL